MLAENDVDQVEAEEADAPQADNTRKRQDHPDDRVPPESRVAEKLGRSEPIRTFFDPEPASAPAAAFQRSGSFSRMKIGIASTAGARPIEEHGLPRAADLPRFFKPAQHETRTRPPACCQPPKAPEASLARKAANGPA